MKKITEDKMDALYVAWSEDRQSRTPKPLAAWLDEYPDCAEDLLRWTADTPIQESASLYTDSEGETRTREIGRQVIAEMRARYSAAPAPLVGLVIRAKERGLNAKTLAERLGIGITLVAKLDQRHLRVTTIPARLLAELAEALDSTFEQVRDYLRQPPTLAAGAMYKSDGIPQVGEAVDFAEAVRASRDMTPERKAYWLAAANNDTV